MISLLTRERKRKRGQKQDCLTIRWPFCVRRSCQIKNLFHLRLRQVPNPSRPRNPHRLVCLRTWLRRLPVFRSSAASSFTFWKSTTYILEKHDSFVRFYAMQSIIFGGAWILFAVVYSVAHMILTPIPAIGLFFAIVLWVIWALVGLAFLVLFIVTVVKAFTGVRWEIPYIGPMARQQMEKA